MNNSMINDSLVERTPFIIPELSDSKFTSAELADDMDGLQLSFQRAKIPGGGVLQFEMPGDDPENPDYEPIDGTHAEIIGKVVAVVRRY